MTNCNLSRRQFLTRMGTVVSVSAFTRPAMAQQASQFGVQPNLRSDQTLALQKMLEWSARRRKPVYLAAGTYAVSALRLPDNCELIGVPGKTTIVNTSLRPLIAASDIARVSLKDIVIDGVNLGPSSDLNGLVDLRNIGVVSLDGIEVRRATNDGIYIERCGGVIQNSSVSDTGRFGVFGVDCKNLDISNNDVENCADGGIIIHRSTQSHDGTTISQNRISNIGASRGGTGQWGNGINVFRADNVIVEDNDIADCAFTAIRANSTHNIRIERNSCLRSGETAIYAEFAYTDATIKDNLIDGAANGISATNLNNGGRGATITGNNIRNITAPGPYKPEAPYFGHGISVEADALVAGNTIENAARFGINAGWGPYLDNVKIINNEIRKVDIGIGVSSANGAGVAMIKDNLINARNGTIRSHQWDKIAPEDLAKTPAKAPKNIILERNKLI